MPLHSKQKEQESPANLLQNSPGEIWSVNLGLLCHETLSADPTELDVRPSGS